MLLIGGMRFDESTGTMVPDPQANTKVEIDRMLAWQRGNGAGVAKRMPAMRKTQRERDRKAAARSRVQLTGTRTMADIKAGRDARAAAKRVADEAAAAAEHEEISELEQRELDLEHARIDLEAANDAKRRLELDLARAKANQDPSPVIAQLQRDQDQLRKSFGDVAEGLLEAISKLTARVEQLAPPAAPEGAQTPETAPAAAAPAAPAAKHEPQHHQQHQKKHR